MIVTTKNRNVPVQIQKETSKPARENKERKPLPAPAASVTSGYFPSPVIPRLDVKAVVNTMQTQVGGAGNAAREAVLQTMRRYIPAIILESVYLEAPRTQAPAEAVDPDRISTIPRTLAFRIEKTPEAPAFYFPDEKGNTACMNWREVGDNVKDIAGGLRQIGLAPGEAAAIFSPTRVEWILADLAINSARGITCAVMPGNTGAKLTHILNDSQSKVLFVENDAQLEQVTALRHQLPNITRVVNIAGTARSDDGWVIGYADLKRMGQNWHANNPGKYEEGVQAVSPEDVATLLYTSGTTGAPKGVEIQHSAWSAQQESANQLGILSAQDKQYLWLPLAHSFGKFLLSASVRLGLPSVVDGNPNHIASGLATTHPTFTAAVPRVFEKIYNGIMSKSKEKSGFERMVFHWAMQVGREVSLRHESGKRPDLRLAVEYALADALVFSKIREKLGGKLNYILSGGAPLSSEIARGFDAMGLPVLEGYGLTETSGASHVNHPASTVYGTVGKPLPGVIAKLSEDPDSKGEILIKGANLMKCYHNLPEKTAETFTSNGFFKTGDIGQIDARGNLRVTDRIKNIFKLSTGEYVAPAPMEQGIKDAGNGLVSNVLVHGYNRKFCTAVIALDENELKKTGLANGSTPLNADPNVRQTVQKIVDKMNFNLNLKGPNSVCKFFIAPTDFAVGSELTETQKVVRQVVETKYRDQIEALYKDAAPTPARVDYAVHAA